MLFLRAPRAGDGSIWTTIPSEYKRIDVLVSPAFGLKDSKLITWTPHLNPSTNKNRATQFTGKLVGQFSKRGKKAGVKKNFLPWVWMHINLGVCPCYILCCPPPAYPYQACLIKEVLKPNGQICPELLRPGAGPHRSMSGSSCKGEVAVGSMIPARRDSSIATFSLAESFPVSYKKKTAASSRNRTPSGPAVSECYLVLLNNG